MRLPSLHYSFPGFRLDLIQVYDIIKLLLKAGELSNGCKNVCFATMQRTCKYFSESYHEDCILIPT